MCTRQWRPKSTNSDNTKKIFGHTAWTHPTDEVWQDASWDMHTTSHSWSSSMTSANGRMGFNTDNKWGLVRYTDGSNTNNYTGVGMYNGA
jgi:hypothetical protein